MALGLRLDSKAGPRLGQRLPWHALGPAEVLQCLGASPQAGLDAAQAEARLLRFGPNRLRQPRRPPALVRFFAQFKDLMVGVLAAAALVSLIVGEMGDALVIMAIVVLNAVLGFVQERRAERSLEALKRLAAPRARVLRGGRVEEVPAETLVPGDLLLLESGDRLAADARLLEAFSLEVEEAGLTGESAPVPKSARAVLPPAAALGDRCNLVFAGTSVASGHGQAVVVATGMATEMGRIAGLLEGAGEGPTPLERRLAGLGRALAAMCLVVCGLVVAAGVWRGQPPLAMALAGISLAVAAVPEGLPAVVTVCLALGVQRMARRRAIVRRLPAVETLGCATVLCSDKTGTITQNRMALRLVLAGGRWWEAAGDDEAGPAFRPAAAPALASTATASAAATTPAPPPAPAPAAVQGVPTSAAAGLDPCLRLALEAAVLCSNAELASGPDGPEARGDPTEAALVKGAARAGLHRSSLEGIHPRTAEIPFDPRRRLMAVACRRGPGADAGLRILVKGAPGDVVARCSRVLGPDGRARVLDPAGRAGLLEAAAAMAAGALRVLAVAARDVPGPVFEVRDAGQGLVALGLLGLIDPPRPEVRRAVRLCREAGVRPVMVTGDHAATARAVAEEIGLVSPGGRVVEGSELERMGARRAVEAVASAQVFARVSPAHKLRIVRALKAAGHVVAMTGDGTNDAPAVKEADIGVAMGRSGTDVTREAAALVLADDNFATLVEAVEEGRGVYANIRKFIRYLLSCNAGEVLVMLWSLLLGLPPPLLPTQLLWMNLVTDGLPALALALEPPDPEIMRRPPRPRGESLFAAGLGRRIALRGTLIGALGVVAFWWGLARGEGLERARTLAFCALVLAQLLHVFDCRSEGASAWELGWASNRYLVGAVALSAAMLLLVVYVPVLQPGFHTTPLDWADWVVALASGALSTAWLGPAEWLAAVRRHLGGFWVRGRPAAKWPAQPPPARPRPQALPCRRSAATAGTRGEERA